ncbi:hypothetical protein J8J14_18165 [Roseomonas sp. SSH11]|uniref:Uncharacterized protein n=1 Tax=Pararoseomonas baculiformis TaxID=2820812 RepID=A0ABS4AI82_9PROT|nr:hypothetical protein [Pararoseomonas baculiformis]MBP0446705.1 hypothetical protein [Pararoseomonas baculiformis]
MPKTRVRRRKIGNSAPIVRLVHIPAAVDADSEPRVALEVPPRPGTQQRRPVLLMFASMAAALAGKRAMEASR